MFCFGLIFIIFHDLSFHSEYFPHFDGIFTCRSRPGSSNQLFKQGKGRPPSAASSKTSSSTRPSSSSSLGSTGENLGIMSGSDSGVEIPASPGEGKTYEKISILNTSLKYTEYSKPSFGSLPKVKTKDDLLKMLHTIKTDEKEMEIEEWN